MFKTERKANDLFTARFARDAKDAEVVFMLFSGERPENSKH
jgi:DNA polymerase III delta prime subunit